MRVGQFPLYYFTDIQKDPYFHFYFYSFSGVSPPPSIEITECESPPDSEDEDGGFQPLVEEKPDVDVDHDSLDSLEGPSELADPLDAEKQDEPELIAAAANAEVDRAISAAVAVAESEAINATAPEVAAPDVNIDAQLAVAASTEGEYGDLEDIPLFKRRSPISRISYGGGVYPESADSPQSFASLDEFDIGVRAQGSRQGVIV